MRYKEIVSEELFMDKDGERDIQVNKIILDWILD